MPTAGLSVTEDASLGEWIAPRFQGDIGAVAHTVPSGYAAYVRICHPAGDREGPVSWSQVAAATARTAHPLMQWHALVGSADPYNFTGSLWPGDDPERGNLAQPQLEELCKLLAGHTAEPERCFLGVWIGWGWVHDYYGPVIRLYSEDEPRPTEPPFEYSPGAFSAEELCRPRLRHRSSDREYVLLAGPLSAVPALGHPRADGGFSPRSPNLLWPADREWCVASEIDFDSTLVGGPDELIGAVLDAPGLDAWPVGPQDSLTYDADRINTRVGADNA